MITASEMRFPYVIMAPHYRESSSGVQVMHRLCHLLNEQGYRAAMLQCQVNPAWNTPVVTYADVQAMRDRRQSYIAVYPDIVSDDPLAAPVAVRYMLNREGVVNGNTLQSRVGDLFFWYRREFAEKAHNPRLLDIECYDLTLFSDDNGVKTIDLLYLNRVPQSAVDFSTLPAGIEILAMRNAVSLEALAAKLKRARVLYTYESSGTCTLAALCGCPVVTRIAPGHEQHAITAATIEDNGNAGFSWDDSEASLQHARINISQVRDKLLARRENGKQQLIEFIALTQQQAQQRQQQLRAATLQGWLETRQLPPATAAGIALATLPRLLVCLFVRHATPEAVQTSLASIASQGITPEVLVISQQSEDLSAFSFARAVAEAGWREQVNAACLAKQFDWLHCIPAGTSYTAGSLLNLSHFLASSVGHQVIATDELWQTVNGAHYGHFRAQADWDLMRLAPHYYLQRALIAREALDSLGPMVWRTSVAFEYNLLTLLHARDGIKAFAAWPDVLTMLPEPLFSAAEQQASALILQQDLLRQGYQQPQIDISEGLPLSLHYGDTRQPLLSVIVLAGTSLPLLERCITSFLQKNSWSQVELLVINHRHDLDELNQWIAGLATIDPERIRVLQSELGWQPVALYNQGADFAAGEYLLLLDSQLVFVTDNWLSLLMAQALRPDSGFVGPKFIGSEQQILSAGVVLGHGGLAAHTGAGEPWDSLAQAGRFQLLRRQTALNGQCLILARVRWQAAGGFDRQFSDPGLAELDLQLRVQQAGAVNRWTPHSIVATDGAVRDYSAAPAAEQQLIQRRWLHELAQDASYSSRCTLLGPPGTPDEGLNKRWLTGPAGNLPLLVMVNQASNDPFVSRFNQQLTALEQQQQVAVMRFGALPPFSVLLRMRPQALILTGVVSLPDAEDMAMFRSLAGCPLFCLADETMKSMLITPWLHFPALSAWLVNSLEQQRWLEKRKQAVRRLPVQICDDAATVIASPPGDRARVLCDLRGLHDAERTMLGDAVAKTAGFIDWVCLGEVPTNWLPAIAESHRTISGPLTTSALDLMQLDLAVIIRLPHDNNRFKDAWPVLLYLSRGVPVLCSDITSLETPWPVTRVRNKVDEWCSALSRWHQQWQQGAGGKGAPELAQTHRLDHRFLAMLLQPSGISGRQAEELHEKY